MKDHFEKFLGMGNASDNQNDLLAYSYDGSELQGTARIVLFPSQEEQLRLILSYANRANLDVIPRGHGGNMMGMTIPSGSVIISTQGFDRIHALNVREQWVKVDCGVTIAELNDALIKEGFRYPLEPFGSRLITIGAFLATDGMSRHSLKYGKAHDTVLELEVMDGTGKYFTVTKDFADYLGLEGSVFLIIRAKLRVIPFKPRSVDVHYFDTIQEAIAFSDELATKGPLAIEFMDGIAATYAGVHTKHTLMVEWEHDQAQFKYEDYVGMMRKREAVRKGVGLKGYTLMEDCLLEPYARADAIEWCRKHEIPVIAHLALGIVHPFFRKDNDQRELWYSWLSEHQQLHSGQFGWGLRKKKYVPAALKSRDRTLKEKYDYGNTLCRGKLHDYI